MKSNDTPEMVKLPGIDAEIAFLRALIKMTPLEAEIIIAVAAADMNVSQAGRSLYRTHTSVAYHLKKVRMKTGLNPGMPRDFYKLLPIAEAIMDGRRDRWFE